MQGARVLRVDLLAVHLVVLKRLVQLAKLTGLPLQLSQVLLDLYLFLLRCLLQLLIELVLDNAFQLVAFLNLGRTFLLEGLKIVKSEVCPVDELIDVFLSV